MQLEPVELKTLNDCEIYYPTHFWRDGHDFIEVATSKHDFYYQAKDKITLIKACCDLHRVYQFNKISTDYYLADEFNQKTYRFDCVNGNLENPTLLHEEGEFSVTSRNNKIYIAAGDIFICDKSGQLLELIQIKERPTGITYDQTNDVIYISGRNAIYLLNE